MNILDEYHSYQAIIDAVPGHDPLPLIPRVGDAAAQARPVLLGAALVGAAVVV